MNLQRLSFDSMPLFEVPFRFFVTAPIFAVLISILLLLIEPIELSSRWTNFLLAATHGFTLGFMLMVMLGALFQILPVVLGVSLPNIKFLSIFVHLFVVLGNAALIAGLYTINHYMLIIAAAALFIGIIGFLIGLVFCVPAMRNTSSSWAIRLASLSLLITIGFGFSFIVGWIEPSWFPNFRFFTNIHLLWGLIGWVFLLIMGVSFQIIPMFYVTPDYPKWLSNYLPPIIFMELIASSMVQGYPLLNSMSLTLLALTTSIYPVYTLYLIANRKRKTRDVTIWFWKTAMISYLFATVLSLVIIFYNSVHLARLEILLATTILFGFAIALITGMLLKIVPFLVWLNIQQSWIKQPSTKMPLSHMQQVIPNNIAKRQYLLFLLMLFVVFILMSGSQTVWLIRFTALVMFTNFGYLLVHLIKAKLLYNQLAAELSRPNQRSN